MIKAGDVNPVIVRAGKAIFIAASAGDVERSIQASKGVNLSTKAEGRVLNDHNAFVAQTVEMKDYLNAMTGLLDSTGDPAVKMASAALKKAVQTQKDPAVFTATMRLEDGLEFRLDGLDKVMPLVISAVKEMAPLLLQMR